MIVSAIAAIGKDGVIGRGGRLPWHLPDDLRRFRSITWGKPIIMGRTTYESLGRALPGRTNIILTRQPSYAAAGCSMAASPTEALTLAAATGSEEAVIIGGGEVFRQFLPRCERIYLTVVEGEFEGDAYFPVSVLDSPDWEVIHEERHPADARNGFDTSYRILKRRDA